MATPEQVDLFTKNLLTEAAKSLQTRFGMTESQAYGELSYHAIQMNRGARVDDTLTEGPVFFEQPANFSHAKREELYALIAKYRQAGETEGTGFRLIRAPKILAIISLRETTGLGLREAKEAVEKGEFTNPPHGLREAFQFIGAELEDI